MTNNLTTEEIDQMKKELNFVCESQDAEHAKTILFELMKTANQIVVIRNSTTSSSQAHRLHKWIRKNYYCAPIRGGWIVRNGGASAAATTRCKEEENTSSNQNEI